MDAMDFKHKVALVVGGTGGIGYETAAALARGAAQVIITGRDEARTQAAAARLQAEQPEAPAVVPMHGDAADEDAVRTMFERIAARFGRLDVLVHVAGISGRKWGDGPLDVCTGEGWDVVMNANARSVYGSNKYALQLMLKAGGGSIVNVSSVLGLVGEQKHFATHAYAASRGAVIAMTRSAAVYYAKSGIRLNTVCPGLLDTPMSQRAVADPTIRAALEMYQPLAPHIGAPADVAAAILFLASDQAKFITGTTLAVDGGWTAQ